MAISGYWVITGPPEGHHKMLGSSEDQSLVNAGSGRDRAGALTNFCMLAAGGCTLLLSLLCRESTRNVSFSLRAAEGKGQLGMGPSGLLVPCVSLGYGKAPRSPWRQEGTEGSTLGQEHKGDGGWGVAETARNAPDPGGGGPAQHCLHHAALVTSPELPLPAQSPSPAPHPHHQAHNPTSSPTTPSPPQPPACLGSTCLGTGQGNIHPIPLGMMLGAPQAALSPSVSRKPPPPPLPITSGSWSQWGQLLRLTHPPGQAGQQQQPASQTPAVLHAHQREDWAGKGGFGEGRASPACPPVCFQDLILFRTSDRRCWSA